MRKGTKAIGYFFKSSGIFFLGNVLSKAIMFFLLPLYTFYIPVEDMGKFDLSITYLNMVTSLIYFELWSAVLRFMYDEEYNAKTQAVQSGFIIFAIATLVYLVGGFIFGCIAEVNYMGLILAYGFCQGLLNMILFAVRGLGQNIDFAISGIIGVMVNAIINIIMIACCHFNYSSMYYAFIIASMVQIVYLEIRTNIFRLTIQNTVNYSQVNAMFKYAFPLCANTLAYWFLLSFNRLVVNWELGDAANGIYAVGYKFGMLITLVTTCFTYAWQDISFSHESQPGSQGQFYSKACDLYIKFLIVGMLIILPLCKPVFNFMVDSSYKDAETTIPLFLLVAVIAAISGFIGNIFYAIKETKTLFLSTVIAALINCAIVSLFVNALGIDGANISVFVSFVINILIRVIILRKHVSFALNLKSICFLTIWCVTALIIYAKLTVETSFVLFMFNGVISLFIFQNELPNLFGKKSKGKIC